MSALLTVTATTLVVASSGASNAYYSGTGYDTSYPQCTASLAPSGFAIVGVSHGRPFTSNACAGAEWQLAGATTDRSLYFNTGYALAYAKDVTSSCSSQTPNVTFTGSAHEISAQETAWRIGCSESAVAFASEPGTPTAWWADVETGNSWSTDTALNRATIDGVAFEMHFLAGVPFGVYSTPSMWNTIVGTNYSNSTIAADWQAAVSSCPGTGFTLTDSSTYAPVWLVQSGTTTVKGTSFDQDVAC